MPANTTEIEKRLWNAADELRANSKLRSAEYSVPVLGLIFLRYADHKFAKVEEEFKAQKSSGRWQVSKVDYQARGVRRLRQEVKHCAVMPDIIGLMGQVCLDDISFDPAYGI